MTARRLARLAGRVGEGLPREAMAEVLESRVMLAGFDPAGAGIGDQNVAAARTLSLSDVTFVDINGSGVGQYDRVRVSADVGLNGVLKLRFGAGASLGAGSTLEIISQTGGTGLLGGAFLAIDGLDGPNGSTLDLVAIQSPTRLVLVATSLPSADVTIAVDDDADVAGLIAFFAGGTADGLDDEASAEGTIHAFGQRIAGLLNFAEADDAGEAFLEVGLEPRGPNIADKARVVVTSSGVDALSVYGTAAFTLRSRISTGGLGGGLRLDGDFNAEAYAFLDSDVPVTAGFDAALGPISLEDVMPSVGAIVVDGQSASLDATISGSSASLSFVAGQTDNPGGVIVEAADPTGSITIASSYSAATMSVTRAQGSGAFSLAAAMFTVEVPEFVMGSATSVVFKYDPNGGEDQEIIRLQALSVEIPKLKAKFDIGNPDADDDIPGLIVYKNGFEFTDATFTLNTSTFGANTMPDAQGFLRIGASIKVRDPSVGLSGFVLRYDGDGNVSQFDLESVTIGAAEVKLGTDTSFFRASGTGLAATILLADNGAPSGFAFTADNLTFSLGSLLEVSADDVVINPQPDATDDDDTNDNYLEVGSLTITLDMGGLFGGSNPNPASVPFAATMRNFAVDADGDFVPGVAPDRFSIGLSLSLGDMSEFLSQSDGPEELPAGSDPMGGGGFSASVDVFWDDINAAPDHFVMVASFSIFGTVGPLTLSGSVSDLVFDSERIFNGDFPIVSVRQITASVSGSVFGAEFNGTLIAGALTLDSAGVRLSIDEVLEDPTRVDRTVLYFGAKGGFEIAGKAGFELLFGFSTEGFIQAYVRAGVPILLDPITGLTITDFRGGITLNGPELPELTDPVQLRSSIFKPTLNLSEQEWADQLARITLNQIGGGGGFLGTVADADMESLDNAATPGVAIPQVVQNLLLNNGFSITSVAEEGTVTVLLANDAWLITDRGRQFLIFRNGLGDFDFYFLGSGAFVVTQAAEFGDLPTGMDAANAADVTAVVDGMDDDGNPFPQNLVGVFLSQGIEIPDTSQVTEDAAGSRWKIVANGVTYTLRLMGEEDSQQVYVVSGGDGASFNSAANSTNIRVEAGFTLYSQYVSREVTEFQIDAIIDSSGRFLISGKMLFGNTGASAAALSVDVKLYFDVSQLNAGTGSVNLLSDFYVPSASDPAEQMLVFSVHGFITFGFFYDPATPGDDPILIDSAYLTTLGFDDLADLLSDDINGVDTLGNNPDFFEIQLSGSPTAGLAVFQASDLQTFTLGAPDPNAPATGPGSAALRFRNDRLEFEFDCGLSASGLIEANNFVSAAGMFVLEFDTSNGFDFESVYGVAQLSVTTENIVPLALAGIRGQADFILKINTDDEYQELDLQLPGRTEAESFPLPGYSFGLFAVATLTFSPPGAGSFINQQIIGAFALEVSVSRGFELFILGTMPLPIPLVGVLATPFQADVLGVLIINAQGVAGRLELGVRTDGPVSKIFDLQADLQMYFNTTRAPQDYRLPSNFADRFVDELPPALLSRLDFSDDGSASITIPAAAPLLSYSTDGATSPNVGPYLVLQGAGHLFITPPGQSSRWLDINGAFRIAFSTPTPGPNTPTAQFDFLISGSVAIEPLGAVQALGTLTVQQFGTLGQSNFAIETAGQVSLGIGLNLGILSFSGAAAIQFNTFDTPQPADPSNPGAGMLAPNLVKVYVDGALNLGGVFSITGTFSISNSSEKLSILATGNISLFGLTVSVGATAEIYKGDHPGLVLNLGVTLSEINIPGVFRLTSSGVFLRLNTRNIGTNVQRVGAAPGVTDYLGAGLKQFEIGNISMTLLSSITISGSAIITSLENNPNGNWKLAGTLGFNLFGAFNVTASGEFYDTGAFRFDAGLYLQLGPDEFNINGTLNVHVSYLTGNAAPFNTLTAADLNVTGNGSLGVHCSVDLGEIDLGLLGTIDLGTVDFDFTAVSASFGYTGSTGELWIRPCVNVGFDLCYTFSIGFIAFSPEPPINLAGPAVSSYTQDGNGYWNATWSGGTLFLNTGDSTDGNRARLRNLSGSEINEIYTIEAVTGLVNGRQTLKVKAFGKEQSFENVQGINAAFGNGNDNILINPNVLVPINVSGGEGNDKITYQGTAVVTINGNGGNDRITAAGGAGSTINGGEGDDVISWMAGNGANVTISGGGGAGDQFIAAFTNARDRVRLARPGSEQFRLSRLNDAGTETEFVNATSGFESLRINTLNGNDEIRITDFTFSGLQLYVDVSRYQTGTQTVPVNPADPSAGTRTEPVYGNDAVADLVIVEGGSGADTFTLTSPVDSGDFDADTNTTERVLTLVRSGVYTLNVLNSTSAGGDALQIDAKAGTDTVDASGVAAPIASLTLVGGEDADTLRGSPFNDLINGGGGGDNLYGNAGNDTLDGGLGDDTYTGGLGTDTYADAGGLDTFVEARQADLLITDATFIVGSITVASRAEFADQFASVSEFESLLGIFEVASLTGGSAANVLIVGDVDGKVRINGVLTSVGQQWSGRLDLVGGLGGDLYVVTVFGSAGAVINIVDTGSGADGTDSLRIFGSNTFSIGDTFLLRPSFVAALPAISADGRYRTLDRVNFTSAIEGGLTLNTLLGDDLVVIDDNTIPTVINTGGGRDLVQIGQIFGSERIAPSVALGDEFGTTAIDLTPAGSADLITGFVSNGASHPLTVNGGEGNDRFVVFRNLVAIDLNGEAGNDTFTVRAFALAPGAGGTARVSGGGGADFIEYAINANVDINGGDGLDAVLVLGTQFNDTFVVTENGVSGSGLSITFTNVETLELHAGDGNDTVYVLATPENLRTAIFGGAGSDRFFITGQAPGYSDRSLTLGRINGPVLIEGGPGDPTIFALPDALMIPGETDRRLPAGAGGMSGSELPADRDTLDIIDTDATTDDVGLHAATLWPDGGAGLDAHTLSGLGMGGNLTQDGQITTGGISYRRLEIVELQLGSGGEFLTISSVAADTTTVFRGNGGSDRFTLTAAAASGAFLVILGDGPANSLHSGTPGGDFIDASSASQGATIYGGPGTDTILGGSGPDRIAGGSGADVIGGGGGNDVIFGDSGLDFDRVTRTTTLRTSGTPGLDNFDVAAADVINPGQGQDIVFGDHGRLTQSGGQPGVLDPSSDWAVIETVNTSVGGNDLVSARSDANPAFNLPGAPSLADGDDLVFGGFGADTVVLGAGDDMLVGDHGRILLSGGSFWLIETTVPTIGDGDALNTGPGNDRIIGGAGSDLIDAGSDDDTIFGDHGRFDFSRPANANFIAIFTGFSDAGAADTIMAGAGHDIVLGQQGDDLLFGQDGDDDLIGGHNVGGGIDELDDSSTSNDRIDGGSGHDVIVGDNAAIVRTGGGSPRFRTLTGPVAYNADGGLLIGPGTLADPRGVITRSITLLDHGPEAPAGTSGHDLVAGGFGDDMIFGQLGNDTLRGDGLLSAVSPFAGLLPSASPSADGDDYIEGNTGNDSIWGDLGRDDLIGGSSDLFGLSSVDQRADGSDVIYGGTGSRVARNDLGDATATGHASDSDYIAGDNAGVFRLVDPNGAFLTFAYDNYSAEARLLPRGLIPLDYAAGIGGAGGADEIRGEAGDDTAFGMTGDDTLYGDGQDDDLYGGVGNDWMYGGTGHDGIVGDDGLLSTARNGTSESIYGIGSTPQETVNSGASVINTTIFTAGRLNKYARLHAFTEGGADVIYGGLGDDFIHAGAGIDSVSGAEALAAFYNIGAVRPSLVYTPSLRRFTVFDPGTGLRKMANFFLNFDATQSGSRLDDGRDMLFGDHGHDWLVGGTNQDWMFGGMGDDVLNADDNLDTNTGLNFAADSSPFNESDIAFGGGGLDRLLGNTTADRLIDWVDQFNQYLTPFVAGSPTVVRTVNASLVGALLAIGRGAGSDQLLVEPSGELGLVQITDPEWTDQLARPITLVSPGVTWIGDIPSNRDRTTKLPTTLALTPDRLDGALLPTGISG